MKKNDPIEEVKGIILRKQAKNCPWAALKLSQDQKKENESKSQK